MTDFARLVLDADTRGLRDAERDLDRFAGTARRSAREIGASMQRVGVGLSATLTAPITLFGVASFQAASDAAELQSAFDQTFGEMSASMNEWAETTGDTFGRSTQAMQTLANSYGLFFNNLPVAREEAARMSQVFSELTQDFASFHNLTEDEAMTAFRSGLAGETEALRRYGIDVSAAAVETQALTMGLAASSAELTEQDKILARYNLILAATTNAQGDVMRTSEGTANQVRTAGAAFEELQVAIGEKLLPAVTPLISGLGAMLDGFARLPSGMQTTIVVIAGIVAAVGPLLIMLGTFVVLAPKIATGLGLIKAAALGLLANPVILGAAAVLGAIYLAWQNWDKIKPIVDRVSGAVSAFWNEHFQPMVDMLRPAVESAIEAFREFAPVLLQVVGSQVQTHIAAVSALFTALWEGPLGEGIRGALSLTQRFGEIHRSVIGELFITTLEAAVNVATRVFEAIAAAVRGVTAIFRGEWGEAWREALNVVQSLAPEFYAIGQYIVQGLVRGIRAAPGAVYEALRSVVSDGVTRIRNFLGINSPSLLFMGIGDFMMQGLAIGIQEGETHVRSAMDGLATFTADAGERVVGSFDNMAQGILGSLRSLVGSIQNGGFFDILGGLVGLFSQVAGTGAFSSSLGSFFGGARADGGAVSAGKSYLVGERGPELFTAPGNGRIVSNDNMPGPMKLEIVPSPYFDVRVNGQIMQSAPAVAEAGASLAQTRSAQSRQYQVR